MSNVVNLHRSVSNLKPVQLDLFSQNLGESREILFLDLSQNNQDSFLSILSSHSVKTVWDTRQSSAFPKYNYEHKDIFQYFYNFEINYQNHFEILKSIQSSAVTLWLMEFGEEFKENVLDSLNRGSCLVLFDTYKNQTYAEIYRKLLVSQLGISERKSN